MFFQTQDCQCAFCLLEGEITIFFFFKFDLPSESILWNLFVAQRIDTQSWKVKLDCHLVSP